MNGVTFDAGGLIALDRRDRCVLNLLARVTELGGRRDSAGTGDAQPRQASHASRLVRQASTDLVPLDGPAATTAGLVLARRGTSDIVDAHVALCAQRAQQPVITSDPEDLQRIAPDLTLISV